MQDDNFLDGFMSRPYLLILPISTLVVIIGLIFTNGTGLIEIQPGEAAVKVNTMTGSAEAITDQGMQTYIPFFQRFTEFDIEPRTLTMDVPPNRKKVPANHDYMLTVRANDGSEFWFDRLVLHYSIIPDQVLVVYENFGTGDGYQVAMRHVARSILRDEYGRLDFETLADPSAYGGPGASSMARLNDIFNPLGVRVTNIDPPKAKFDDEIETAIEERQRAQQEIRTQETVRSRFVNMKGQAVAQTAKKSNAEYASLGARLRGDFENAKAHQTQSRATVDAYAVKRRSEADAQFRTLELNAGATEKAAVAQAKALRAQINAVGAAGHGELRRIIAVEVMPKMAGVKVVPYAQPIPVPVHMTK